MYRTLCYRIKNSSRLYNYSADLCYKAARFYNRANFVVRNYATAVTKFLEMEPLTANELEVYQMVQDATRGTKYRPEDGIKWLTDRILDFVLRSSCDADYRSLPAQSSQQMLKQLMRDYKSFFESTKAYKRNPSAFTGRPGLPRYKGKTANTTVVFTNQDCVIKNGNDLKFPKTKHRFHLGDLPAGAVLKEARIRPCGEGFTLHVVLSVPDLGVVYPDDVDSDVDAYLLDRYRDMEDFSGLRVLGIDPGLNNLCTVVNNVGEPPLIISGKILKSVNRLYNKELARLKSAAELCNRKKTTKHIRNLTAKRNRRILDMMHKISRYLTDHAVRHGIQLVVFGHNGMQKQGIHIGKTNNQNFVQIPMLTLVRLLRYKLNEKGIEFVCTEESYTSMADFKAMDELPVYSPGKNEKHHFSGKRVKRGLYRHFDGSFSNADCNGGANIIRKVFPKVGQWDSGCVDHPYVVTVA